MIGFHPEIHKQEVFTARFPTGNFQSCDYATAFCPRVRPILNITSRQARFSCRSKSSSGCLPSAVVFWNLLFPTLAGDAFSALPCINALGMLLPRRRDIRRNREFYGPLEFIDNTWIGN